MHTLTDSTVPTEIVFSGVHDGVALMIARDAPLADSALR